MQILNKLFDVNQSNQTYLLVGSPNVGKSSIFNRLTWKNSPVANYDRLTTNYYYGSLRKNKKIEVVDLPGISSLNPVGDDEKDSFDYIFNKPYEGVINIVNANSLQRDLYLTVELAEANILNYLVVNMIDELEPQTKIKKLVLTKYFKVPISLISAKNKNDINELVYTLNLNQWQHNGLIVNYLPKIEEIIKQVENSIHLNNCQLSLRFLVTQAIIQNQAVISFLDTNGVYEQIKTIIDSYQLDQVEIDNIINAKHLLIKKIISELFTNVQIIDVNRLKTISKVDKLLLNPWFAIPIFILIIAAIYFITFYEYAGGYLQALLAEQALGQLQTIIYDSISGLANNSSQMWWAMFVSDGIFGGIFTIISFLPWIIILFLLITILEQIGFLARMSIVFDNVFAKMGLSGRSIVNLVTGIGCNVPAILLAKNSNSIKEKVVSIFIAPFVSCSARVVVFGFLGTAVFGDQLGWLLNIIMTFCSIMIALFVAYCFSNIWFRKTNTMFISQLPRFRMFDIWTILKKIWIECWCFIKRTIIIVGIANLVIWILMYMSPTNVYLIDPFDVNHHSFLWYIAYPFNYILYPLGIGFDWRFGVSLLSALPAKEIIASNIELLFGNINDFSYQISLVTPFVNAVLFSYLFFISFYIPCMATIATMKKEIGNKYTLIHICFSLIFAYVFSFVIFSLFSSIQASVYQLKQYEAISSILVILVASIIVLVSSISIRKYLLNYQYMISKKLRLGFKVTNIISLITITGLIISLNVLVLV